MRRLLPGTRRSAMLGGSGGPAAAAAVDRPLWETIEELVDKSKGKVRADVVGPPCSWWRAYVRSMPS